MYCTPPLPQDHIDAIKELFTHAPHIQKIRLNGMGCNLIPVMQAIKESQNIQEIEYGSFQVAQEIEFVQLLNAITGLERLQLGVNLKEPSWEIFFKEFNTKNSIKSLKLGLFNQMPMMHCMMR